MAGTTVSTSYPTLNSNNDVWNWAKLLVTRLNQRDVVINDGLVRAGSSVTWRGGAVPAGWLKENGASVTKDKYPTLFAAIGYTYGGSGANFNIPNSGASTIIKY